MKKETKLKDSQRQKKAYLPPQIEVFSIENAEFHILSISANLGDYKEDDDPFGQEDDLPANSSSFVLDESDLRWDF